VKFYNFKHGCEDMDKTWMPINVNVFGASNI